MTRSGWFAGGVQRLTEPRSAKNLAGQVIHHGIKSKHKTIFVKTFLTIIITAGLTCLVLGLIQGVNTGIERLWLVSAIKVPGQKAIAEIQGNLEEGRYDLAKAKLQVFSDTWRRFNNGPDTFGGLGIGDVLLSFVNVETNFPAYSETNQPLLLPASVVNVHSN